MKRLAAPASFDLPFAFLLGALPFSVVVRLPPFPGFWGQWTAVTLSLMWLAGSAPTWRRPINLAAVPLLGLAAWLAVQAVTGKVALPIAALLAALLLIAAALVGQAAGELRRSERWPAFLRAFCG